MACNTKTQGNKEKIRKRPYLPFSIKTAKNVFIMYHKKLSFSCWIKMLAPNEMKKKKFTQLKYNFVSIKMFNVSTVSSEFRNRLVHKLQHWTQNHTIITKWVWIVMGGHVYLILHRWCVESNNNNIIRWWKMYTNVCVWSLSFMTHTEMRNTFWPQSPAKCSTKVKDVVIKSNQTKWK